MIQAIQSFKESLLTTTAFSSVETVKVVTVSAGNWGRVVVSPGERFTEPVAKQIITSGVPIATRIKSLEKDARKKAALERARSRLAEVVSNEGVTLTALRLRKGMSQTALAELIESKQSYIARIENKRVDVRSSTLDKLVAVLGEDRATIMSALECGWKLNEEKEK